MVNLPNSDSKITSSLKPQLISQDTISKKIDKFSINFSFSLFNRNHRAFNLGCHRSLPIAVCGNWFIDVFDTLQEISKYTPSQLVNGEGKTKYGIHPLRESANFNLDLIFGKETAKQLSRENFYQVEVLAKKSKGRIHFYIVASTLFIVLLDPYHNMYNSPGYEGVQSFFNPITCYEQQINNYLELQQKFDQLLYDYKEMEQLLDEKTKPL